ncbi:hypothetical protein AB0I00_15320 [Streptomyces sp. NPDC050803]|uniref:hypothetical protein n=1 Tax=unclassified Streptomyces TaxID=2593676 RepID=UPI0034182D90
MSTTPQMSQLGQQFPSTSPYQQQQQPYGQQGYGQQQPFGSMGGSLEQLQQLGQQQPYQQLLQQMGQQPYGAQVEQQAQQAEQQTQQQLQQVVQAAVQQAQQQVQAQPLAAGLANGYIDIVHPLPGQPRAIYLRIANLPPAQQLKVLINPTPQAHDEVQEAFAFGHQVIGIWDTNSPHILRSIRVQKFF